MTYSVKLLPVALRDLRTAKDWYNSQKEGLGEEFKYEIDKAFNYLTKNPKHFQKKHKDLRQAIPRRFPYLIFFRVREKEKQIVIFGVIHSSRHPEIIQERKKTNL